MLRFLLRRLGHGALTLAALVSLTFFVIRLAPGGPFSRSRRVSPDMLAIIEARFNLDEPLVQQFARYVWGLVHFDFGPSTRFRDYTVGDILASGLPYSLTVGFWAMLLATVAGVSLGILGALRRNSAADYTAGIIGVVGIAVPLFVIAPLLQVAFALKLGWFPVGALDAGWRSWVLPVIALSLPNIAYISRLTRTAMIETARENFVRTARAKGIGRRRVILNHTLTGTLLPVIAYLGPATAAVITGSILIETIFALPGIGRHFVDAALNRDYPLVMGVTLVYGAFLILFNILTDALRAWLDPRVRHET
jgi:oligopeptide transport system permease protein